MTDQAHLGADASGTQTQVPRAGIQIGDEDGRQAAFTPPDGRLRWLRGTDPGRRYRLQQSGADILILFVALQIGSIIYALAKSANFAYLTRANLLVSFQTIPLTGIVALGVGLLMIAGEFDLSVGANFIFSSVVVGQLNSNSMNVWLAALIGLAVGLGIGLLNGFITLVLKLPSFIATLGTMGFWEAAVLFYHGATEQTFTPTGVFNTLTNGT